MGIDAPDHKAQALADLIGGRAARDATATRDAEAAVLAGMSVAGEKPAKRAEQPVSTKAIGPSPSEGETPDDLDLLDEDDDTGDPDPASVGKEGGDEPTTHETDEEEEADDEKDGDQSEEVDYDEDDEFSVQVDGETKAVTLRELLKAYSGEGAISKRLQEATEARREATVEKENFLTESARHRENLLKTVVSLENVLLAPMVNKPDPALRATDINAYLMQKDAYDEDQNRINTLRGNLAGMFAQQEQTHQETRKAFREQQAALLREKVPAFKDPTKAAALRQEIIDTASHYGFSPAQVADVDNHGLLLMAIDAGRYLKAKKMKADGHGLTLPSRGETESAESKVRRLRAGTIPGKKTAAVTASRKVKAAEATAKASGKVDDVANFIMLKARSKGKPNGRRG